MPEPSPTRPSSPPPLSLGEVSALTGAQLTPGSADALEVTGPIPILRALQAALAGTAPAKEPADLSRRETVAAAIQISDNAERVAGMAE